MDTIRHIALGCCVISTVAGMIRVFWPENGFTPVINTVLALYIITAVLQVLHGTDWRSLATEVYRLSSATAQEAPDFSAYSQEIALSASVEAIQTVLRQAGIDAAVQMQEGVCHVTLLHAEDRARAESVLASSCGTMSYQITAGGEEP